jgi:hypothetical protein
MAAIGDLFFHFININRLVHLCPNCDLIYSVLSVTVVYIGCAVTTAC